MNNSAKPPKRPAVIVPLSPAGPRPLRKIDDLPPGVRDKAERALNRFITYAPESFWSTSARALLAKEFEQHEERELL